MFTQKQRDLLNLLVVSEIHRTRVELLAHRKAGRDSLYLTVYAEFNELLKINDVLTRPVLGGATPASPKSPETPLTARAPESRKSGGASGSPFSTRDACIECYWEGAEDSEHGVACGEYAGKRTSEALAKINVLENAGGAYDLLDILRECYERGAWDARGKSAPAQKENVVRELFAKWTQT